MINNSITVFIRKILWSIALGAMFFQCYYPQLSSLIVPAVLGYILLNIYTIKTEPVHGWLNLFVIYMAFIVISALVSCLADRNISHVLRFTIILIMIPFVIMENIDCFNAEWKIFKRIIGIKAISIIVIWMIVFIQQDYIPWREWAYSLGVGDIYILYGIPRVQLQGNALLTFAAIADIEKNDRYTPFNILMIISVLCAGNSAFYLGLFFYLSIRLVRRIIHYAKNNNSNGVFLISILIVFAVVFLLYGLKQLELKSNGVEDTNRVRIEQAQLLTNTNPVFGTGVGAYANGSISTRTYVNATYFELQSLYVYYQIGLIGMVLFFVLTYWPIIYNQKARVVYLAYLIYAFWNPYCFDSTHIMVMILLVNLYKKVDNFESRNWNSNGLLSGTKAN